MSQLNPTVSALFTAHFSAALVAAKTNVFTAIAMADTLAADTLAAAFRTSANIHEVYACLRMARTMGGYCDSFAGWLDGAFFAAAMPNLHRHETGSDAFERDTVGELFAEFKALAWDYQSARLDSAE